MQSDESEKEEPKHASRRTQRALSWAYRITALILTLFCAFVLYTWYYGLMYQLTCDFERVHYDSEVDMELVVQHTSKAEIKHYPGYKLVEFIIYSRSRQDTPKNKRDDKEIPVLFIVGNSYLHGNTQHLARMLRERTKETGLRFRWYAVEFNAEVSTVSGETLENHHSYVTRSIGWLIDEFKILPIIVGQTGGGVVGFSQLSLFNWAQSKYAPDLLILQLSAIAYPPYTMDDRMKGFYDNFKKHRNLTLDYSPVGVVSFSGGIGTVATHTEWTGGYPNITRIPAWTIDGVPDCGMTREDMMDNRDFLNHVGNLLVMYGKRPLNATGKDVVEKYYSELEKQKISQLPEDWKTDTLEGAITVRTGETYDFTVNKKQWVVLELKRDENIQLNMTSPCLSSVTVIRAHKHIRRYSELIDRRRFEIGVFQTDHYEDVRLLFESEGECRVLMETSPWWLVYGHRFLKGFTRDLHFFIASSLAFSVHFIIMQGQMRWVQHMNLIQLMFLVIIVGFYHAFYNFGTAFPGIICGCCFSLFQYFLSCTIYKFYVWVTKWSMEYWLTRPDEMWRGYMVLVISGSSWISPTASLSLLLFLNAFFSAPFLMLTLYVPLTPLLTVTYAGTWGPYNLLENLLKDGYCWFLMATSLIDYFLLKRRVRMGRIYIMAIAYITLFCQLLFSDRPLEYQYFASLFILMLHQHSVQYIPSALFKSDINLQELEEEYIQGDAYVKEKLE